MVKNLHFCTWDLLKQIKNGNGLDVIETYRTGFVPMIYAGDILNLNKRVNKNDALLRHGTVKSVIPIQYKDINEAGKEEIRSCNRRKFKDVHWFFKISIVLKIVEDYFEHLEAADNDS